jgi:uncharacterized protein (TIGR03435 family)
MWRRLPLKINLAMMLVGISGVCAQTFDVASIRPAALPTAGSTLVRFGPKGGPGTDDPGLYTCSLCNFSTLLTEAYDLKRYQVIMPDWMVTTRFDINAKVPAGTTREQFRVVMQNLLTERFKLTSHRDKKEMDVYALVIMKGGHKLKDAAPPVVETPPSDPQAKPALDKDGFVISSKPMPKGSLMLADGKARIRGMNETIQDLAERLSLTLPKPVVDATGLTGRYDYVLTFASGNVMIGRGSAPAGDPNTPLGAGVSEPVMPIESEVQTQLGLKLEPRRAPVEVLVVDHAEKIPTEN